MVTTIKSHSNLKDKIIYKDRKSDLFVPMEPTNYLSPYDILDYYLFLFKKVKAG